MTSVARVVYAIFGALSLEPDYQQHSTPGVRCYHTLQEFIWAIGRVNERG